MFDFYQHLKIFCFYFRQMRDDVNNKTSMTVNKNEDSVHNNLNKIFKVHLSLFPGKALN